MEGEMGCRCGGAYGKINGRLVCVKCGLLAPYQPLAIEKLITENDKLKAENAELTEQIANLESILQDLTDELSKNRKYSTRQPL